MADSAELAELVAPAHRDPVLEIPRLDLAGSPRQASGGARNGDDLEHRHRHHCEIENQGEDGDREKDAEETASELIR